MTFGKRSKSDVVWWALGLTACMFVLWTAFRSETGAVLMSQDAQRTDPQLRRLFIAATVGNAEKLDTLLRISEFDTSVVNKRGDSLLRVALLAARARENPTLYSTVTTLLLHGANPNLANNRGRTVMHAAAAIDNEAVMTALIQAGGDPLISSNDFSTPYEMAVRWGNLGTVAAIEKTFTYRPDNIEELKELGRFSRTLRNGLNKASTVAERRAALRAAFGAYISDPAEAEKLYQKSLSRIQDLGTGFLGDCDSCEKIEGE